MMFWGIQDAGPQQCSQSYTGSIMTLPVEALKCLLLTSACLSVITWNERRRENILEFFIA